MDCHWKCLDEEVYELSLYKYGGVFKKKKKERSTQHIGPESGG